MAPLLPLDGSLIGHLMAAVWSCACRWAGSCLTRTAKGTLTPRIFAEFASKWATRYADPTPPHSPPSPSLPPPPNGLQVFGLPSPLLPSLPPPPHSPLPPRSTHSQVSDRDIENMLTVMSPSLAEHHQHGKGAGGGASAADEGGGAHGGAITEEAGTVAAKISFERYKMTMQSSFTRTFQRGQYVIAL